MQVKTFVLLPCCYHSTRLKFTLASLHKMLLSCEEMERKGIPHFWYHARSDVMI